MKNNSFNCDYKPKLLPMERGLVLGVISTFLAGMGIMWLLVEMI